MIRKVILSMLLLIALTACNMNFTVPGSESPGGPTTDPQVQIDLAVAQTYDAQTQVAQSVLQTMAAIASNTPEFTFTPSLTSTPTFTLTPSIPMVSVSVETNCRTGPGQAYDILGVLPVGQSAEMIGRTSSSDTWVIKLPSNPAIICWLWAQYSTPVGNTAGLPVYPTPPTPTPAAGFTLSYVEPVTCGAMFGFRFQLTNNGSLTWQSYKVDVTDSNTSVTKSYTGDEFLDSTSTCIATTTLLDLTPGETGFTGNWYGGLFGYNPAGHHITATFRLCSEDGMAGTCTSKSISFTP